MPAKAVASETMEIGQKGGGKHWTAAEVSARQEAAGKLKRKVPVKLKPPDWLSPEARRVWMRKLKEVAGLNATAELLDVLDTEMLAVYCNAYVQYREAASRRPKSMDDIKELQVWSRIIASYADKLGFNPSARVRLVKKRADEHHDKFGKKFD